MRVDLSGFELQNMVLTASGLRTRKALVSLKAPSANTDFVGGFSVKSPRTTEPWHFIFEQANTGAVTARCFTEEFFELWNFSLGAMQKNPVITKAEVLRQIMVNSPSFSAPAYGLVGGGWQSAVKKQSSINDDTTALDIPPGHIAAFGDRVCIATGDIASFNDAGVDPRTFVVENQIPMPGVIYDHFQGPDKGMWFFTSGGAFTMPQDALGQGQEVQGGLFPIPGIDTTRSRNAAVSGGFVAVLQEDHLLLLPSRERIPLITTGRRRRLSQVIQVDDLRKSAELFTTPKGFYVGFRGQRGFFGAVNPAQKTVSWVTGSSSLNLVGVLTSRDGEALPVTSRNVLSFFARGRADYDGAGVAGVACGAIPVKESDNPVIRRVTVAADNVNEGIVGAVDGTQEIETTPVLVDDVIIGTTNWDAKALVGRATRSTRLSFDVRSSDPTFELQVSGADRAVEIGVDVELAGQGRTRRDGG